MFETVITVLFAALLVGVVRSSLKLTWGVVKIGVLAALILGLPALVGYFVAASGIFLLMPLGVMLMALGVVKACA